MKTAVLLLTLVTLAAPVRRRLNDRRRRGRLRIADLLDPPVRHGDRTGVHRRRHLRRGLREDPGAFVGGGVQVVVFDRFVAEIGASRARLTGERAFHSGGTTYRLGIPLTATITPLEVTGGYRFPLWEHARPYVAAGFGSYSYKETSDFSDPGENIDTRRNGFVVNGGFEFRLHRWVGVAVDVQYSRREEGILGEGGLSQQFGEDDLGGVAARFKLWSERLPRPGDPVAVCGSGARGYK